MGNHDWGHFALIAHNTQPIKTALLMVFSFIHQWLFYIYIYFWDLRGMNITDEADGVGRRDVKQEWR